MFHQLITSSDRGNMFACDQCQYKAGTKALLKIHHNNLHQDMKYTCNTCGHQTSSNGELRKHQQVVPVHQVEKESFKRLIVVMINLNCVLEVLRLKLLIMRVCCNINYIY